MRAALAIAILLSLTVVASLLMHAPMPRVVIWWMRLLAGMVLLGTMSQSVRLLRRDRAEV